VKRIVAFVALLGWATACVTPTPFQPLSSADPLPRRLLDGWAESASHRQRLRGLARLAIDRDDGSLQLRSKQLVILERPSSLRVEILGFLNQSLAVIATDGDTFEVYRADGQSFEEGKVDADLLWNEAGIDLRPEEAVAVLLGVPVGEPLPAPASAARDAQGRVRIDLPGPPGYAAQRVTFDPDGRLSALETLDASGAVLWSAQFGAYREVDGSAFAHSIELDVRSGGTRAEITFRNVELNPELPPGIFQLPPPRAGADSGAGER
jgi:hypothetical protein